MFKHLLLVLFCWVVINNGSFAKPIIKIYTTEEPPLNFSIGPSKESAVGGDITGFTTDVVREILALTNNTTATIVLLPWARAYQYALHGKNIFIFSMGRTKQREKRFHWVGPIAEKKAILYGTLSTSLTINSLEEAKAITSIATVIDDSKEQYLKSQGFVNLSSSPAWNQAVKKLFINRAILLAQTDLDIPFILESAGFSSAEVKPVYVLYKFQLYIGASRNTSPQLVNAWQQALDTTKKNGRFKALIQKWASYYQINNWRYKDGMLQVIY